MLPLIKTLPDATAEELLEKMPAVSIVNGKIQAQSEDVKKILVDGKLIFQTNGERK